MGGEGADTLGGADGADDITGSAGADAVAGNDGDDVLYDGFSFGSDSAADTSDFQMRGIF